MDQVPLFNMRQIPLFLILSMLGCLYPEVTEAFAIAWFLVVVSRLV
ncbi:MAG: hypothetical protein ABI557_09090 [Aureliella sp.]